MVAMKAVNYFDGLDENLDPPKKPSKLSQIPISLNSNPRTFFAIASTC